MMPASMLALSVASLLSAAPATCPVELFRIERSKNANVVLYEVKRRADGTADPREPLTASWLMLADAGQREGLNFLEQRAAYGFDVKAVKDGFEVHLRALAQRAIRLAQHAGCLAALTVIAGRQAVLRRIYVKADDSKLIPDVLSVEVHGVDVATGEPVSETLKP